MNPLTPGPGGQMSSGRAFVFRRNDKRFKEVKRNIVKKTKAKKEQPVREEM